MKTIILLLTFLISVPVLSQDDIENEKIDKQELKEIREKEEKETKEEKQKLKKMAYQRATELQKELNLTNFTSLALQEAIYKYSKQANKVIQSNVSKKEKTIQLSNIVYFQNQRLKEILTVKQFYRYLDLSRKRS